MNIAYYTDNTKVFDGYKYNNSQIEEAVEMIIQTRKEMGLPVTRTEASYINEWKAHNRLYKLGIQRNRTKDVDLEEDINKTRNFLYAILGI